MSRYLLVGAFVLVAVWSCSPLGQTMHDAADVLSTAETGGSDSRGGWGSAGDTAGDVESTGEALSELIFSEVREEETGPACAPGEGCFLDHCEENGDCLSGWCVEHMGEGVCTTNCQEECPPGWTCKLLSATGPDPVYICVSDYSNLCKPCAAGEGCKSPGGADDVCVDYGVEGSFCGGACEFGGDEECPWGFACKEVQSVEGVPLHQCVSDTGLCPCTGKSVALGLSTPCVVENDWGSCLGMRFCAAGGLTECDAVQPGKEVCNGLDDDCDGDTDEPDEVQGNLINLCDDGNPCTTDLCNGEADCDHEVLEAGECMDGDACTIGDHCEAGECVGTPIQCDDENPCTDDYCDGIGGCIFEDNGADCDDGDPCTVGDECEEGVCGGFAVSCACQEDADCLQLEDGDLCNGELVCDTAVLPYVCAVDPATVIECPAPPEGPDAFCQAAACDPLTGECAIDLANDGFACDDGNACTVGDKCGSGICAGGPEPNCNDGNPCTDDSCAPATGCVHENNQEPCEDGDVCTTDDLCAQGQCAGGLPLGCDDENVCNGEENCDSKTGCVPGEPLNCDDGNACTGTGICDPEEGCLLLPAVPCDDGNPCTDDSCDPVEGCVNLPNQAVCSDGNECTQGDHCADGTCSYAALIQCDDDNLCTTNTCDPATGCVYLLNGSPCDDESVCTTGDHCHLGECISSGELTCNDYNVCTDDSCDSVAGCEFAPNDSECDDGSVCTAGDLCSKGWCLPGPTQNCDDGNSCTDDGCDPVEGCQNVNNVIACDDSDACTEGDECLDGACLPGGPLACDDFNDCTQDFCESDTGCVHSALDVACDDGDLCTDEDHCDGGLCVPGAAKVCNDSNGCTDDSCDVAFGCVFVANAAGCTDGDACTDGDLCDGGACVPGPALSCADDNPCTADTCDEIEGCQNAPLADGEECGLDLVCQAGQCTSCGDLHGSVTFNYTGAAQPFAVPECVTDISVDLTGGSGGTGNAGQGGQGGRVQATIPVSAGAALNVYVGGAGVDGNGAAGGWNGGGSGGASSNSYGGGGGGGASDIRTGAALGSRLIVAGAGGGGGADGCSGGGLAGGAGGGAIGGNGQLGGMCTCDGSGHGGTQSEGGSAGYWDCAQDCNATPGSLGQGGTGNTDNGCGGTTGGGGGGGGYFGGGGGGLGAGGGGSSFAVPEASDVQHQQGGNAGNGQVTVSW